MLLDRGSCFHGDGWFPWGQTGVFSDVDGEVCVERLQLFGEELVGQRVEAVRAPVESGPFQEVKSRVMNITPQVCLWNCMQYCQCQMSLMFQDVFM